jgi:hypothetical protein
MNPGDFRMPVPNQDQIIFFVLGIAAIVLILIIVNLLKTKFKVPALNGTQIGNLYPRKFSVMALHRVADDLGLNRGQTKMLDFVMRTGGANDPARELNSPILLDRHFKRAYRLIERSSSSEDEMNTRLSVLFATRNIIDANAGNTEATSTRQIPENAAAVLKIGETNYPIRVISSRGDSLVVENPVSSTGEPLRLPRGSKASLSFYTKSSKGFSVESRILGSMDTADGPVLQLVHSGQIKKLSNRQFRRRQTVISTNFYFVHVEEKEKKKDNKLVVDKRRFSGSILDISIGGCSIKTNTPVNSGQRLKIEFTREDNSIVAALGEVLRANRSGVSSILHIKFLKVPNKSLNSINAMVYEYNE